MTRLERDNWIKMKYIEKKFLKTLNEFCLPKNAERLPRQDFSYANDSEIDTNDCLNFNTSDQLMHYAVINANLPLILYAIALDADRNSIVDNQTPLIKAVISVCRCFPFSDSISTSGIPICLLQGFNRGHGVAFA